MKIRSFHVKYMAKFEKKMVPVHHLKSKVEYRCSQIRCENKATHDNIQKIRWNVEKTYSYACQTINAKLKLPHLIILKLKNNHFPTY